ncbi:MAG: MBL fold metallo-hydrolase [Deltaproteobacteria bacterium]|nr:MBL fold metallo-hydrolase [Deltaproteobacteria bacterium]
MNPFPLPLEEVDRVEIVTLMDNYSDVLLKDKDVVSRPHTAKEGEIMKNTFLAEHGLSLLVTVWKGEDRHTILFDAGYTDIGVPHNLRQLGIDVEEAGLECIVISHGHMDHSGALYPILDMLDEKIPLLAHPSAFFSPRYVVRDDGTRDRFPVTLIKSELEKHGAEVMESKGPSLIADNAILVTGEIERSTDFELGFPNAFMEKEGELVKDPISDDQSIVINLKGKGMVLISGCAHAGIINTLRYAGKMTGIDNVQMILGGFHLSGPAFEPIIEKTIEKLKEADPKIIVPMHCTGWKAIKRISEAFPAAFILNSVGSRFTLE